MGTTSSPTPQPVLGYILKGYPRISETFISNEILLLEKLGFSMHLFPMRQPRENFCHESVKKIVARVSYLPTELLPEFPRLLLPNLLFALKQPIRYRDALLFARGGLSHGNELLTLKHLFQAGFLANYHLGNDTKIAKNSPSTWPFCPFPYICHPVCINFIRAAIQLYSTRKRYLHFRQKETAEKNSQSRICSHLYQS